MHAGVCTTTRQLQAARSTQLTPAQMSMVPEWTRSLALHGTIERTDDATMQHTGERKSSSGLETSEEKWVWRWSGDGPQTVGGVNGQGLARAAGGVTIPSAEFV